MSDVPNPHPERLIAGWGAQQIKSKDEREKKCDCEAKKPEDGERKVLVRDTR